jgi:hypothetical protein
MNTEQLNEVKKLLYKQNPKASLDWVTKIGIQYSTEVDSIAIVFIVPFNDIGDAKFDVEMDAKLLIRYINTINKITE